MKKKVILIDGNSLVYRAFFALPTTLATSKGVVTNAVYGFTSMLIKLIKEEAPHAIVAAFDSPKPTFRHKLFEKYKAQRPETPDELGPQIPLAKKVLGALKIPVFEMEGYEADDILATLAKKAEEEGYEVLVVTGDKDALQLVSSNIKIMTTRKGISDIVVYDRKKVLERYGIEPEKVIDMLGLKGDPSDNIPGVPGIGEKTASKLIREFGSLEEVIGNIDKVSPPRFKKALEEHIDEAKLSKELAVLKKDLPLKVDFEKVQVGRWDGEEVRKLFTELEFSTLLQRLDLKEVSSSRLKSLEVEVKVVKDKEELEELAEKLEKSAEIVTVVTIKGKDSASLRIEEIAFAFPGEKAFYLPLNSMLLKSLALTYLRPVLEASSKPKVTHDGKSLFLAFKNEGIEVRGIKFDTMIASYLLESTASSYVLDGLAEKYLGVKLLQKDPPQVLGEKALIVFKLKDIFEKELKEKGMWKLFSEVEMPLLYVLAEMELAGVGIDVEKLKGFSTELEIMIKSLEKEIFSLAGEEFNLNSPQQLGKILFEKLGLKAGKKTKTGYSTDSSVLLKLAVSNPIAEKILAYRELSKLKSTYVDALPRMVNPKTRRLHTSFSQTGTATGRLSSSNPNLQNIPIRTELGRRIREAFVPARETDELLVADYSQIELRLLASFSKDKGLIKAFKEDKDIHAATASEIFEVELDKVTPELRRRAKAVNFGIVYGMQAKGLAERLGISVKEAQDYIDRYFKRYPGVKAYVEFLVSSAYKKGYAETILGRRRYLPELKSGDYKVRSFGERSAINMPLQGSAADIIKMAMVKIRDELKRRGLQTRMVLQVHDELIFEVPPLEKSIAEELVRNIMENIYPLEVKLKVDLVFGSNWKEAK